MAGETTELKLPFPEEKDEANQGATKIKELAERVDLLLRKQLTKLTEVAKLKVTETIELPAKAIEGAALGSSTIRQETGTAQSFISWGIVSEAGASEGGTADWSVTKIGTGEYEVKWTKEKTSALYSVSAQQTGVTGSATLITGVTVKKFVVITATASPANRPFTFMAIAFS